MHPEMRMLGEHRRLFDNQLGILLMTLVIPVRLQSIQTGIFKPYLLPLFQLKFVVVEVVLHSLDEVIEDGVLPLELVEVFGECLGEVLLLHDEEELFHGGCSLAVGDAVEDGLGGLGVGYLPSNGMGSHHLVFSVGPTLPAVETGET